MKSYRYCKYCNYAGKSDMELLQIAFEANEKYSSYSNVLKTRFSENTGETLTHKLSTWAVDPGDTSGKIRLLNSISNKIQEDYYFFLPSTKFHSHVVDISREIKHNMPRFSTSLINLSEMISIGGVQEVEIFDEGFSQLFNYSLKYKTYTARYPDVVELKLLILLKDWFGVSESDYIGKNWAVKFAQNQLVALWILQHQRNFKPFINIFEYRMTLTVNFK